MMPEQDREQDPDDLPPGTALCGGRFVIEACLGRGGVATVYRVCTADGRRQALKLMVTRRAADGDQRERFENEWRIGKALRGLSYVVSVDDGGRHDDGRPFFTMELVEAPTLADLVADRSITVNRACRVAREVAHALDDLHTRGVVHRDIKPDNIMVTPEGVRLLDFGYAYTRGSEQVPSMAGLTSSEHRPGTALYMAPEQADGEPPTPSFDVYALAVTLYEALVGHAPNSEIPPGLMMLHKCRGGEELSIEGRMGGLHPALVQLIDHALRRKPTERVRSAAEFRDRLDAVLEQMGDEDSSAGHPPWPARAVGVSREHAAPTTLAFLPVPRRAVETATERVPREVPLRPAIGGGRGETMPVPAAEVMPSVAAHAVGGQTVSEELQAEEAGAEADEQAELLAQVDAGRHSAEQAATPQRAAEPADAACHSAEQAELLAQDDAGRHSAEQAATPQRAAEPADAACHSAEQADPARRAAEQADAARQAAEQAEQLRTERHEAEAAGTATATAETTAGAEVSVVADARASGSRVAPVGVPSAPKWVAAVLVVLLLGVGAWWTLGGDEPQEGRSMQAAGVTAEPEPGPELAPTPIASPETKVQPTPEPTAKPEPEPAAEPEPEATPATKPGKPSRKVKPPRTPAPAAEACTDVAAEASAASRSKKWSRVLQLTKSARCWGDSQARIELRVEALSELGRYAECSTLGAASKDPEVRRMAKSCAAQIDEEKSP